MEDFSIRGHRQYLKRGGECSYLSILQLLQSKRGLLSEKWCTVSIDFFLNLGVCFCSMEILPCGWLNHEIGP